MAFWNRKKSVENSELPEEVREYYASTKRSRFGAPWIAGLLTLLLTLAIAVALYFAGKFVWEQFFADDTPQPIETTETTPTGTETETQPSPSESGTSSTDTNETPATLPGDGNSEESSEQESESSSEAETSETTTQLQETPDTGPGDTVAIFVATTVIAGLGYEAFARKKQTN